MRDLKVMWRMNLGMKQAPLAFLRRCDLFSEK